MATSERRCFLDRLVARGVALLVILLCAAALAYLHRDDLFPGEHANTLANSDPVAACAQQRITDIDRMVTEGTIEAAQAERFKQRAMAMCQDAQGHGISVVPIIPSLPAE